MFGQLQAAEYNKAMAMAQVKMGFARRWLEVGQQDGEGCPPGLLATKLPCYS